MKAMWLVVCILAVCATWATTSWWDYRREIRRLDVQAEESRQQTERYRLLIEWRGKRETERLRAMLGHSDEEAGPTR